MLQSKTSRKLISAWRFEITQTRHQKVNVKLTRSASRRFREHMRFCRMLKSEKLTTRMVRLRLMVRMQVDLAEVLAVFQADLVVAILSRLSGACLVRTLALVVAVELLMLDMQWRSLSKKSTLVPIARFFMIRTLFARSAMVVVQLAWTGAPSVVVRAQLLKSGRLHQAMSLRCRELAQDVGVLGRQCLKVHTAIIARAQASYRSRRVCLCMCIQVVQISSASLSMGKQTSNLTWRLAMSS
mmetsp:Transcript_56255/g.89293  ORF Transcript_56255/g.89293 Transcript_56255/m.89293 type:complete len:241 (-) Transcript_56255:568-1290(-)